MPGPRMDRKRSRKDAEDTVPSSVEDRDLAQPRNSKRARVEDRRSLFVRSLPSSATTETLTDFFSQHFPVKHAVVVVDQQTKESRGFGFVTFADADDAAEAKKALDKKEWDGRRIRIDVAEPRSRDGTDKNGLGSGKPKKVEGPKPTPKLIVRNLPWSIKTPEQLTRLFISYGKVKFADLPSNKGKLKGFGFVTIRGIKQSEKAIECVNGKEVDGRTLAVDWAVDKKTWDSQQQKTDSKKDKVEKDEEEDDESDMESNEDDDEDDEEAKDSKAKKGSDEKLDDGLEADLENFMKNHMQNMEDESDSDEEKDEEKDESTKEDARDKPGKKMMTDNSSTVFIRNMPFTTTDEQLKSFFSHFGTVRYARVVFDKVTKNPAGTGFVCFFNESDAKTCVKGCPRQQQQAVTKAKNSILQDESADPDGRYTLDGRLLSVAQAVGKDEANNLADSSLAKRREKDKRRLFLLSEGAIGHGSSLHTLLTPMEVEMRQKSANQRRKLVQGNPTLHISLTRLALRNIPRDWTSKELKELARKAIVGFAKDVKEGTRQPLSKEENARDGKDAREKERERRQKGKGIVRQAKIVFESTQGSKVPEASGAGKSRGYGFIEYTSHHWALMGLRYLNGHQVQGDNGKKQRLIVEFAIENAQVVQRRRATESQSGQAPQQVRKAESRAAAEGKGGARANKRGGNSRAEQDRDDSEDDADETNGGADGKKEDMKQKLIARKRLMRKKKANARGAK